MAKNDLFKKDWIDVIFENRNKSYGAYKLRLESSRTTIKALGGSLLFLTSVCTIPVLASNFWNNDSVEDRGYVLEYKPKTIDKEVKLVDVVIPEEKVEKVVPITKEPNTVKALPASSTDQIKHTVYDIVKAEDADEIVATIDDFANATIGSENIKGNENGTVVLGRVGTEVDGVDGGAIDGTESGNSILMVVEEKAAPYETLAVFNRNFATKFRARDMDERGGKLQVILSFVVEKDGSLTDIKVMRDPGYGAGAEAIRVLKTMPKWKAAQYNNKAVRSQFTLPITIQVE